MRTLIIAVLLTMLMGCVNIDVVDINQLPSTSAGNEQVALETADPCSGKRMARIRCKW
jgi:hypothetical protein